MLLILLFVFFLEEIIMLIIFEGVSMKTWKGDISVPPTPGFGENRLPSWPTRASIMRRCA